jgi:hypothetical protein
MTTLLLAVLLSQTTPAEQVKYMPLGTPLELTLEGAPEVVRYFRLPEFKLLIDTDFRLQSAEKQLSIYLDIDTKYGKIIEEKDKTISRLENDKEILNQRAQRLDTQWREAEKLAIENAGGPWWPYILAGAGAVLGIVGVTLYLSTAPWQHPT